MPKLDPISTAGQATIFEPGAGPVVPFLQQEQRRKDIATARSGLRKGKLDKSAADNVKAWEPYWGHFGERQKSFSQKWAQKLSETNGNLTNEQLREKSQEQHQISQEAEASIGLEKLYHSSEKKLRDKPENYNVAASRAILESLKNPRQHAMQTGQMEAYNRLKPVRYAMNHIANDTLLKPKYNPSAYIDKYFIAQINRLTEETFEGYSGPEGGFDQIVTERTFKKVNRFLQDKYSVNDTFADQVQLHWAGDEALSKSYPSPEIYLESLAATYVEEVRVKRTKRMAKAPKSGFTFSGNIAQDKRDRGIVPHTIQWAGKSRDFTSWAPTKALEEDRPYVIPIDTTPTDPDEIVFGFDGNPVKASEVSGNLVGIGTVAVMKGSYNRLLSKEHLERAKKVNKVEYRVMGMLRNAGGEIMPLPIGLFPMSSAKWIEEGYDQDILLLEQEARKLNQRPGGRIDEYFE